MCNFQELSVNESGYIVRCSHCCHYQIYFSGVILSLPHASFQQWIRYIERLNYTTNEETHPAARSTIIATPNDGVHLAVSANELLQLRSLVLDAENEVIALDLLELF